MVTAGIIDKQIISYLDKLNTQQKKAVLTVVKTFAGEQKNYDYWKDESFLAELDKRNAEYESGQAQLYTLDELDAIARNSFQTKKFNLK